MRTLAVAAVPLVLVPALGAVQGGFHPATWVWAGALAAWAAALGILLTDRGGALRAAWPWPAAGGALLVWTLASSLWSAEPQQSVLEARRTVVYVAVALALVVLARGSATRTVVTATHVAVSGLVAYSLARYLLGARVSYAFEGYAISQPLGYSNAVGILAVIAILLALGTTLDARAVAVRAFGAATVPPLALALMLSGSDASWLALGVGILAVAMLAPRPAHVVRMVALLGVPVAPLVWLGHYSRYAAGPPARVGGPALLGAAAAAAAIAAAAVVVAGTRRGPSLRALPGARSVAAAAAALALVAGAAAIAAGGSTQPRSSYYHVAWREYVAHPLGGSGAGTFGRYWVLRPDLVGRWGGALDAHSLYVETLAELGPVGLVLLAAFLLYPLRRVLAARATPGVPAAAGAALAFLVHAGLDWDWELPAVVVAGLACLAAVLLARDDDGLRPLERPARFAALAGALLLGFAAIAGTASATEPSAAPHDEAPPGGASFDVS